MVLYNFTRFFKIDFWHVHESKKSHDSISGGWTIKDPFTTIGTGSELKKIWYAQMNNGNNIGFLLSWTCQKWHFAEKIILSISNILIYSFITNVSTPIDVTLEKEPLLI